MPRSRIDHGTILILDVGRNVATTDDKNQKSFFENARKFTLRLIERKIISQGKNFLGVMLLGSKKTNNQMAIQCEGAFKHIDMMSELAPPTWKLIREMPEKPSNSKGDWIDALVIAAAHFKAQSGVNIISKKIILMTNFQIPTSYNSKDVQVILDGFKEENYEVDIIGSDIYDPHTKGEDIELAKQFVETTDGATANFEYAMQFLCFHRKRVVNAMPWNVNLSIGPNIKIPVSAYIRLKDEPVVKKWNISVKDPITDKSSTYEGISKTTMHLKADNKSVDDSEIIKGYQYGQKIISFSEYDKLMLYKPGDKSLTVYGFTDYNKINWQSLNGDNLYYVFGRKGDKNAQHAVRCLVECLHTMKLVGVVRRVYNNNNVPAMYALFPVIDSNNYVCLSMAALCFKEDIKCMAFPSTKKFTCNMDKVNAIKALIQAMDLTKAYDETYDDAEALPVANTFSPFAQHLLDCISYRAMNPGKPLPKPREEVLSLFKVPSDVELRAKEQMEKLKVILGLKEVEKKQRRKKLNILNIVQDNCTNSSLDGTNVVPKIQLPINTNDYDVLQITTIDPVNDYIKLKNKNKKFADLAQEMLSVIEDLIYCNLDGNYKKGFNVMSFFRKECVDADPSLYNNWLVKFKVALNDRRRNEVVGLISERNVNFILKSENSLSTYEAEDSHDDSQLYENDTVPNTAELTIQSEVNDLFDEF